MISTSVVLGVLALLAGAGAAWFWYESSQSLSRVSEGLALSPANEAASGDMRTIWAAKNHRAAALLSGASILLASISNFISLLARLS